MYNYLTSARENRRGMYLNTIVLTSSYHLSIITIGPRFVGLELYKKIEESLVAHVNSLKSVCAICLSFLVFQAYVMQGVCPY